MLYFKYYLLIKNLLIKFINRVFKRTEGISTTDIVGRLL